MRWIIIFLSALLLAGCTQRECIRFHTERYYDSTGTTLAVSTKNYGLLALNGWKNRVVCDEYRESK